MDSVDTTRGSLELSYVKSQLKPLQSNMPGRNLYDYILDAVMNTLLPVNYTEKLAVESRRHG